MLLTASILCAQDDALEAELEALRIPPQQMPTLIDEERLYAIQSRHNDLEKTHEFMLGSSNQVFGNSHLSSSRIQAGYFYHFNPKWALRANASKVFNKLNSAGKLLLERQELIPDKDYGRTTIDAQASYNLFYGKFRWSMDRTFYFDQYVSLGAGTAVLRSGAKPMLTGDVGFAFWANRNIGIRFGLRNELYEERRVRGTVTNHNVLAHLNIGYLFGQD